MVEAADIAQSRDILRTSVQRMRGTADPATIATASRRAAAVLTGLSGLQRARTVLVHDAGPGDLDAAPLVERLAARGVRVLSVAAAGDVAGSDVVPRVLAWGRAQLTDADDSHLDDLDLVEAVVLPGVAFDLDGGRLGPEADPWPGILRRIDDGALRVGLARSAQLVPRVPRDPDDPDDLAVDVVVTDRAAHHTGARMGPRDA